MDRSGNFRPRIAGCACDLIGRLTAPVSPFALSMKIFILPARSLLLIVLAATAIFSVRAADAPALSAAELAAKLSALQQDGSSFVRLKLDGGAAKSSLQIQIKQRRTRAATEVVYQILWPKERKGEGVLLRKIGDRPPTGASFRPPDAMRMLDAEQMREPLFGSDLSLEDATDNFFAWDHQAITGTEPVDRVPCQILESKPGKGQRSSYALVRTWVDARRLVPLRIEKYSAPGELVRRIETTKVALDEDRRHIPANLTVRGRRGDAVTELDGSRIVHGVAYTDRDFTPDALRELTTPRSAK